MRCEACGTEKPVIDGRHRRFCKGKEAGNSLHAPKKFQSTTHRAHVAPIDLLASRVAALEKAIKALGVSLPAMPNGLLLTSRNAKSCLTQFLMNCEAMIKFGRSLLDLVNEQEGDDGPRPKAKHRRGDEDGDEQGRGGRGSNADGPRRG